MVISLMGLSGGLLMIVARTLDQTTTASATVSVVLTLFGGAAVVMAWLLPHFGYADLYYQDPNPPKLSFPGTTGRT